MPLNPFLPLLHQGYRHLVETCFFTGGVKVFMGGPLLTSFDFRSMDLVLSNADHVLCIGISLTAIVISEILYLLIGGFWFPYCLPLSPHNGWRGAALEGGVGRALPRKEPGDRGKSVTRPTRLAERAAVARDVRVSWAASSGLSPICPPAWPG